MSTNRIRTQTSDDRSLPMNDVACNANSDVGHGEKKIMKELEPPSSDERRHDGDARLLKIHGSVDAGGKELVDLLPPSEKDPEAVMNRTSSTALLPRPKESSVPASEKSKRTSGGPVYFLPANPSSAQLCQALARGIEECGGSVANNSNVPAEACDPNLAPCPQEQLQEDLDEDEFYMFFPEYLWPDGPIPDSQETLRQSSVTPTCGLVHQVHSDSFCRPDFGHDQQELQEFHAPLLNDDGSPYADEDYDCFPGHRQPEAPISKEETATANIYNTTVDRDAKTLQDAPMSNEPRALREGIVFSPEASFQQMVDVPVVLPPTGNLKNTQVPSHLTVVRDSIDEGEGHLEAPISDSSGIPSAGIVCTSKVARDAKTLQDAPMSDEPRALREGIVFSPEASSQQMVEVPVVPLPTEKPKHTQVADPDVYVRHSVAKAAPSVGKPSPVQETSSSSTNVHKAAAPSNHNPAVDDGTSSIYCSKSMLTAPIPVETSDIKSDHGDQVSSSQDVFNKAHRISKAAPRVVENAFDLLQDPGNQLATFLCTAKPSVPQNLGKRHEESTKKQLAAEHVTNHDDANLLLQKTEMIHHDHTYKDQLLEADDCGVYNNTQTLACNHIVHDGICVPSDSKTMTSSVPYPKERGIPRMEFITKHQVPPHRVLSDEIKAPGDSPVPFKPPRPMDTSDRQESISTSQLSPESFFDFVFDPQEEFQPLLEQDGSPFGDEDVYDFSPDLRQPQAPICKEETGAAKIYKSTEAAGFDSDAVADPPMKTPPPSRKRQRTTWITFGSTSDGRRGWRNSRIKEEPMDHDVDQMDASPSHDFDGQSSTGTSIRSSRRSINIPIRYRQEVLEGDGSVKNPPPPSRKTGKRVVNTLGSTNGRSGSSSKFKIKEEPLDHDVDQGVSASEDDEAEMSRPPAKKVARSSVADRHVDGERVEPLSLVEIVNAFRYAACVPIKDQEQLGIHKDYDEFYKYWLAEQIANGYVPPVFDSDETVTEPPRKKSALARKTVSSFGSSSDRRSESRNTEVEEASVDQDVDQVAPNTALSPIMPKPVDGGLHKSLRQSMRLGTQLSLRHAVAENNSAIPEAVPVSSKHSVKSKNPVSKHLAPPPSKVVEPKADVVAKVEEKKPLASKKSSKKRAVAKASGSKKSADQKASSRPPLPLNFCHFDDVDNADVITDAELEAAIQKAEARRDEDEAVDSSSDFEYDHVYDGLFSEGMHYDSHHLGPFFLYSGKVETKNRDGRLQSPDPRPTAQDQAVQDREDDELQTYRETPISMEQSVEIERVPESKMFTDALLRKAAAWNTQEVEIGDMEVTIVSDVSSLLEGGEFGFICKGVDFNKKTLAIKIFDEKAAGERELEFLEEIERKGGNENFIRALRGAVVYNSFLLVLELLGPSVECILRDLKKMPVEDIRSLGAQMILALEFLHGIHVCHGDIQTKSILTRSGVVLDDKGKVTGLERPVFVLSGFNCASWMSSAQKSNDVNGTAFGATCTSKVDLFGLGLVIAECIYGKKLMTSSLQTSLAEQKALGEDSATAHDVISLLQRVLELSPEQRPTGKEEEFFKMMKELLKLEEDTGDEEKPREGAGGEEMVEDKEEDDEEVVEMEDDVDARGASPGDVAEKSSKRHRVHTRLFSPSP